MIAYLDEKEDKKELVFARVLGDRKELRKKIDESKYGNVVDKYCLKKYVNEAMLVNHNGFNESMFCNPNDILENIDIDFIMLEMIFSDDDYDKFIENASKYSSRLLMLKSNVMPFIKLEEVDRLSYKEGFYNEYFEKMLCLNTEILKLMNTRKTLNYNLGKEGIENILNKDDNFDNYVYRPMEVNNTKVKKLKRD